MEPEGSLPCSQGSATDPYPQPDESSPHLPTPFPYNLFYYLPIYDCVSSFQIPPKILYPFLMCNVCYMLRQSYPSGLLSWRLMWETYCRSMSWDYFNLSFLRQKNHNLWSISEYTPEKTSDPV